MKWVIGVFAQNRPYCVFSLRRRPERVAARSESHTQGESFASACDSPCESHPARVALREIRPLQKIWAESESAPTPHESPTFQHSSRQTKQKFRPSSDTHNRVDNNGLCLDSAPLFRRGDAQFKSPEPFSLSLPLDVLADGTVGSVLTGRMNGCANARLPWTYPKKGRVHPHSSCNGLARDGHYLSRQDGMRCRDSIADPLLMILCFSRPFPAGIALVDGLLFGTLLVGFELYDWSFTVGALLVEVY